MDELSTATIEELVTELEGRFDSLIISGVRPPQDNSKEGYDVFYWQAGNYLLCVGLASVVGHRVLTNAEGTATTVDPADL
jgi:hypothetical protein